MGEDTKITELISLTGKRALVTGGLKGIGKSIALRLSESGAKVLVADADPAVNKETASENISFVECDITEHSQVTETIGKAAGNSGLDFLVNNAGIFHTTGPISGGANIRAYSTSKAAILGLTQSFANELGPRGIRVNAIAPGIIDTPGVQEQLEPLKAGGLDIDTAIAANPLRIPGKPDYIARSALFLVSDLAEFITGHLLVVDGGSTA